LIFFLFFLLLIFFLLILKKVVAPPPPTCFHVLSYVRIFIQVGKRQKECVIDVSPTSAWCLQM